jgi:type IV pilus modification protein PilV
MMRTPLDRRAPRDRGFTLIEVLMALAVFGIGVLGLALVIPLGAKKSTSASQQSRASQLAAARAEQLLATAYNDDDLTAGLHVDPGNPYNSQYHVEWDVEVDQPITACKRITINVRRPNANSPVVAKLTVINALAGS